MSAIKRYQGRAIGDTSLEGLTLPSGQPIAGCVVDNYSGSWIYVPQAQLWVPPFTVGWAATISPPNASLDFVYQSGPVALVSSPTSGAPAVVQLFSDPIPPGAGNPLNPPQGGLRLLDIMSFSTSTTQTITKTYTIIPSDQAIRIFLPPPVTGASQWSVQLSALDAIGNVITTTVNELRDFHGGTVIGYVSAAISTKWRVSVQVTSGGGAINVDVLIVADPALAVVRNTTGESQYNPLYVTSTALSPVDVSIVDPISGLTLIGQQVMAESLPVAIASDQVNRSTTQLQAGVIATGAGTTPLGTIPANSGAKLIRGTLAGALIGTSLAAVIGQVDLSISDAHGNTYKVVTIFIEETGGQHTEPWLDRIIPSGLVASDIWTVNMVRIDRIGVGSYNCVASLDYITA